MVEKTTFQYCHERQHYSFAISSIHYTRALALSLGLCTLGAASHVGVQVHVIRTDTGVLGRVESDLGSGKAEVLAASIGNAILLTPICTWKRDKLSSFREDFTSYEQVKWVIFIKNKLSVFRQ